MRTAVYIEARKKKTTAEVIDVLGLELGLLSPVGGPLEVNSGTRTIVMGHKNSATRILFYKDTDVGVVDVEINGYVFENLGGKPGTLPNGAVHSGKRTLGKPYPVEDGSGPSTMEKLGKEGRRTFHFVGKSCG